MTILADRQPIPSGATTQPTPPPELPDVDDAQQFYLSGSYTGFTHVSTWVSGTTSRAIYYVEQGPGSLGWALSEVVRELSRLTQLRPRWDGRRAQPIKPETVFAAIQVLAYLLDQTSEPPQSFPLPNGGIQVEWLSGDKQIEIEIDQSGEAYVVATSTDGDVLAEGILDPQGPSDLVKTVAGLVKNFSAEIAAERQRM
jgi:hypothetical protein